MSTSTVPRPSRRDLIFGGAAAVTAGTAFATMPRKRITWIGKDQLEHVVPEQVGSWTFDTSSGVVLPPPDQLTQLLYDQQVARSYSSPTALPIMLLMAYGSSQSGMLQVHRPEVCYPAGGFKLTETVITRIPLRDGFGIPVRSFVAQSDTRTEHVLYWTRIGPLLPVSWAQQRIAVMRSNLQGYVPDGLLVRLSTVAADAGQARRALELYAQTMLDAIGPARRKMLLGPGAG